VGSDDNNFYAINPDGSLQWSFPTGGEVYSPPSVGGDGTIYVGSDDNNFYAINPDGSLQWSFPTGDIVTSSPAVGGDGTIYMGSSDYKLYAIYPDGSLQWSFPTGGELYSSPAVGGDGTIYVGSCDDKLYAINPDGSLHWSFPTGGDVNSAPAVGGDGTIYVGSDDNKLYAIGPGIDVILTPDATTVERGGTLGYTIEVTNSTAEDQTFQYWSDVYLWTGDPYKKNPVFGPKQVTIKAGMTKSGHLSHKVPNNAPLKAFTLCGRIGWHPDEVWDEDCFEFTVVEGMGYGHESTDWKVIESAF
jgi:outer membrane protein assembly factor BamB